ncbi:hypothetical protein L6452_29862 [Arctium lappa]|uniref:Uncharacterized protein n=1 Tax=Arctium lappa TaxID=4217 RepID=A0ACB8ZIF0_ARCLA|nr:hypothetical protein L6452_29862 [Arctium lappa]
MGISSMSLMISMMVATTQLWFTANQKMTISVKKLSESVDWKFCENILAPTTLFFCHFHMDNKQQVFDVYNEIVKPEYVEKPKREYWRCTWLIKRYGFYFVHQGDTR